MKHLLTICLIIGLSSITTNANDTTKVLFIGNSITYYNDMPQTFEDIANSLGETCEMEMHAPGGTGFANHIINPEVYSLFRQGDWDFIVLQPGTGDSGGEQFGGTPKEETLIRIRTLLDSAYLYNPCSQVLFYEISNGAYSNSEEHLDTYNASMDVIHANLDYFSDSTRLPYAPVGEAFRTSWNQDSELLLWNSFGDIHPNPKGSYLAACVFYSSIFKNSPAGTSVVNTLSNEEAEYFQNLAAETVLDQATEWNFELFDAFVDFDIEYDSDIDAKQIQLTQLSENIDSLIWDFGDGTFSNALNPIHVYENSGNFNIHLKAYQHACMYSISKEIEILNLNTSIKNIEYNIKVFPNPAKDFLSIQLDNYQEEAFTYEVLNDKGQILIRSKTNTLNIANLANGVYFLRIIGKDRNILDIIQWIKH